MAKEIAFALDPVRWAIERLDWVPDAWQSRVMRRSARQTLLNCSRQSGKSTTTAAIAAHTAIYKPGSLILMVSKAQRQSAELLAKVQQFLKSLADPPELDGDNLLSCRLANGSRIISLPGDGDSIRGFSAPSLVVEDEASFVDDRLYAAIRPMLSVSRGRLILMSTPHGRRGHFFEAWSNGSDAWVRESITAYDCPRISQQFLEQERRDIGEWWFQQEYMCKFVDSDTQLFSSDSIGRAFRADLTPLSLTP
ncbi:MAG: terminase large subunit domain-containing protein [Rhodopila sp.]